MKNRSGSRVVGFVIAISAVAMGVNAQDTAWVRRITDPANTPVARIEPAMVFDEQRGVIVMVGGRKKDGSNDPSDHLAETWEYDGVEWRLVSTSGPWTSVPGIAYDAARGVVVVYGGRDPQGFAGGGDVRIHLNDTWEWDGESWTKFAAGPGDVRIARAAMAYDPTRGTVIRHGGLGEGDQGDLFNQNTTWEWDGQIWTQIAVGPTLASDMFYDTNRGAIIIVGHSWLNSSSNQTWEFDGVNWNQLGVSTPSRLFYTCTFDVHRNVAVLYSGASGPPWASNDQTYEWDGARWAAADVGTINPEGRVFYGMAHDSNRKKMVLFGGHDADYVYLNDTWEYGFLPLQVTSVTRDTNQVVTVQWTGEAPPYRLQRCPDLVSALWQDVGDPTDSVSATISGIEAQGGCFRVISDFGTAP